MPSVTEMLPLEPPLVSSAGVVMPEGATAAAPLVMETDLGVAN
jgi:hypothetical protein